VNTGGRNDGVALEIIVVIAIVSLVVGLVVGRRSPMCGKRNPNNRDSEATTYVNPTYADTMAPSQVEQHYETVSAEHEPIDNHKVSLVSGGAPGTAFASARTDTLNLDAELYVGFQEPSGDGYLNVDGEGAYSQRLPAGGGEMGCAGEGAYVELDEQSPQPAIDSSRAEDAYAEIDEFAVVTGGLASASKNGDAYGVVLSALEI
jgi:hypothetical protein